MGIIRGHVAELNGRDQEPLDPVFHLFPRQI